MRGKFYVRMELCWAGFAQRHWGERGQKRGRGEPMGHCAGTGAWALCAPRGGQWPVELDVGEHVNPEAMTGFGKDFHLMVFKNIL